MACSKYNPNLPHDNLEEQGIWVETFLSNLFDDCGSVSCTCVNFAEGNTDCSNCIAEFCSGDVAPECIDCLGNINGFADILACAEGNGGGGNGNGGSSLSTGALAGIIVGSAVGLALILFLIIWFTKKH